MLLFTSTNVSQIAEQTPKQHPNIWFNDGSVTLHVQDTLFRVHESLLCKQSAVFTDMFNQTQGTEVEHGECPIVKMSGDGSAEWANVLMAIYDICFLDHLLGGTVSLPSMDDMSIVSGILRISTKYEMYAMRAKCMIILQKTFPSVFEDMLSITSTENPERQSVSLAIAALAIGFRCPILLPAALYQICMTLPADGSADDSLLKSTVISDSLKAICLSGRARIHAAERNGDTSLERMSLLFGLPRTDNFLKCQYPQKNCNVGFATMIQSNAGICALSRKTPYDRDSPPSGWAFGGMKDKCVLCTSKLKEAYAARQRIIWTRLPSYFGLGESWEKLQTDQNEFDKEPCIPLEL